MTSDRKALLDGISDIARQAGAAIMAIYATDFDARTKDDNSPVTDADEAAEALIVSALRRLAPDIPVVAEEAAAAGNIPDVGDGPFWLVDPLDGTKEFLNRNGEFTVNIALIEGRRPVLGVVLAPALGTLYSGLVGTGAWRAVDEGGAEPIAVREPPADGLTVIASRRHGDPAEIQQFLQGRPIAEMANAGSSLKFCKVAAGEADLYPRFGRTMEWDTGAGQAVLEAAGGLVTETDGTPFAYAKNAIFENPHFVAWGGLRP
ncbi:3'(2'),5'-bisphosphate nucleotidase CysQ [Marivibrio halodurans]|uniref:3'(2'),5'-bisphosphate nucleotidase CysQ n=1 Tax=Marivibrio halodurans TaxID=2039722 RepID=A0A8J7V1C2_9PROT|nr:3'(2'),5'-bisphosphate nucleotidase CysQ [Marivibrio halodurans]MBP5855956.1 3'(2'),5'-bisphosphate nucleotidase CysQ [Marivibrio halodurans]